MIPTKTHGSLDGWTSDSQLPWDDACQAPHDPQQTTKTPYVLPGAFMIGRAEDSYSLCHILASTRDALTNKSSLLILWPQANRWLNRTNGPTRQGHNFTLPRSKLPLHAFSIDTRTDHLLPARVPPPPCRVTFLHPSECASTPTCVSTSWASPMSKPRGFQVCLGGTITLSDHQTLPVSCPPPPRNLHISS